MVGSACFVLGSVPAYADAVGGPVDGITYFVGSIFFTSASFCQLVQAQSPGDDRRRRGRASTCRRRVRLLGWLPHDRDWLAAATQFPGTLFFNISTLRGARPQRRAPARQNRHVWRPDLFGSVAVPRRQRLRHPRRVGPVPAAATRRRCPGGSRGSTCSARCCSWPRRWRATCCPRPTRRSTRRLAVAGTLFGAVCFLVGAALMLPAWRRGARPRAGRHPTHPRTRSVPRRSA